jgi:hypothetical protein
MLLNCTTGDQVHSSKYFFIPYVLCRCFTVVPGLIMPMFYFRSLCCFGFLNYLLFLCIEKHCYNIVFEIYSLTVLLRKLWLIILCWTVSSIRSLLMTICWKKCKPFALPIYSHSNVPHEIASPACTLDMLVPTKIQESLGLLWLVSNSMI